MTSTSTAAPHPMLKVAPEVAEALAAGTPVVALESTIISHGMPYPQNVAMAREVEQIVRDGGAVPATIAILNGRPTVGPVRRRARAVRGRPATSARSACATSPHVVATGVHGATTVASTMRIAALAGIRVFVTGGLGGVHQGAETSMDVSADLTELSRTEVAVISAGVKSILDIGRTLEVLETLEVPVVGYGTDDFPSFFSRSSGIRGAHAGRHAGGGRPHGARPSSTSGSAAASRSPTPCRPSTRWPARTSTTSSRAPSPTAPSAASPARTSRPTCSGRLVELSGGRSLETNLALVRNNAVVGTAIAVAYAALR